MTTKPIITALGVAGLLPFMASLLAAFLNAIMSDMDLAVQPKLIFVFYSAVILSFLCGAFWGRLLNKDYTLKVALLLVVTNMLALAAWISLLLFNEYQVLSIGLLGLAYLSVFIFESIEAKLLYKDIYRAYLKLRFWLTFCVVTMHLMMLIISVNFGF
ncbi:DUF3429 domain-containing protein [Gammaproteobacteria bacterium]|jgi:hypothetical protein|nr:DUF3429 domain-containing protein [Gammaproteobacteria bacterium]